MKLIRSANTVIRVWLHVTLQHLQASEKAELCPTVFIAVPQN